MSKDMEHRKEGAVSPQQKKEPGLMDSIGSFPFWLLKIIDIFTPAFLISKSPPKKKNLRI